MLFLGKNLRLKISLQPDYRTLQVMYLFTQTMLHYLQKSQTFYFGCLIFRHILSHFDKFQTKVLDTLPTLSHQELDWNNIYESVVYCINHQGFKIQRQESNKYSMKPLCISSCVSTRVHSKKKTKSFGAIQMFILHKNCKYFACLKV